MIEVAHDPAADRQSRCAAQQRGRPPERQAARVLRAAARSRKPQKHRGDDRSRRGSDQAGRLRVPAGSRSGNGRARGHRRAGDQEVAASGRSLGVGRHGVVLLMWENARRAIEIRDVGVIVLVLIRCPPSGVGWEVPAGCCEQSVGALLELPICGASARVAWSLLNSAQAGRHRRIGRPKTACE